MHIIKNTNFYRNSLSFLILLTIIQQMPIVRDDYYNFIRVILYVAFGIISLFALFQTTYLKKKLVWLLFIGFLYLLLFILPIGLFKGTNQWESIIEIIVPLGILISSYKSKFNEIQINKLLFLYVLLSLLLGFFSIYYYGAGFNLSEVYLIKGKNQIGPVIGISSIIVLYKVFEARNEKDYDKSRTIVYFIFFLILFSLLLIMRNRAGSLSLLIISLFILFKKIMALKSKGLLLLYFLFLGIFLLFITGLIQETLNFIWQSFVLNYNITDLNSISAGRTDVYSRSISYIKEHFFFGELISDDKYYETTHNYILNKLVKFGVIGSFPLLILYLYLWKISVVNLLIKKENLLVFYVLLFSLIVSLFEYTYPFGPGNSQMMVWFLLGQYLADNKDVSIKK